MGDGSWELGNGKWMTAKINFSDDSISILILHPTLISYIPSPNSQLPSPISQKIPTFASVLNFLIQKGRGIGPMKP
jgi:hypothetical protein